MTKTSISSLHLKDMLMLHPIDPCLWLEPLTVFSLVLHFCLLFIGWKIKIGVIWLRFHRLDRSMSGEVDAFDFTAFCCEISLIHLCHIETVSYFFYLAYFVCLQ